MNCGGDEQVSPCRAADSSGVDAGQLGNPPHADSPLAQTSSGDVVGGLHSHERVHLHSKRFFNAERHVAGEIRLTIQQAGQRGPRDLQCRRRRGHRKAREPSPSMRGFSERTGRGFCVMSAPPFRFGCLGVTAFRLPGVSQDRCQALSVGTLNSVVSL
jgi:hypothetical protein